jgi:photosystem II stability/assembly factor-like uncharacterized protein
MVTKILTRTVPVLLAVAGMVAAATPETPKPKLSKDTLKGLELRGIGPAINSGRVTDFAVTPGKRHRYFVAAASGGVWRTDNGGTTWKPVFDAEGSYSIGCLAMDPHNENVIWVGAGENNSQRSVSFGDGIYKSLDGGTTWTKMGLEDSEHIGRIAIDPRDSDVVYVAAQGPLWNAGGDRGVYKTSDGGKAWSQILEISDDTGANEVWLDPRDPDTLYATAYQRRRHVWTLINGGPESAIYKSTDAGATWRKVSKGLPETDLGRIGLAVSPVDPDVIYAIVEAQRDEGGFYRSTDRGESWERRSDYMTSSPQYYNELVADPHDLDTVYALDTWLHVSTDGGATFTKVGEKFKHVDNHAMWIDPDDSDYLLVGCDGGVYETFDRGATWRFKENLPITQFYRVFVDTSKPFYYVYGGTQDNNSLGGPSRTLRSSGISNEDWFITVGGDGYETVVDPVDPNIVYSQWQYGGLVRYDRRSEEIVDIQPQEAPGEPADRWNWDSPLILSPHSPTRLYYASQRLYRTDDRGDTWTAISGDLSRGLDRDRLPIMGKLWGMDAVSKNQSTSDYGNVVSLTESPLVEGLLYAGTDDGRIQVTGDGGTSWRAIDTFKGVPERTYVSDLEASLHDADTVYATFDNHKMGDFTPYLAVSRDRGQSWTSIRGDLPDGEVAYTLIQDHVSRKLLFAGTELGLWVTLDEGSHWHQLKGGFPTIQVRDLDIQREWNDLAAATFGRGFYILDDYSPLRTMSEAALADNEAILYPTRDALLYIEQPERIGSRGDSFWTADNPPFGAVFTYWLRDGLKTRSERRIEAEKKAREANTEPTIPTMDELRREDLEVEPDVLLVVRDQAGDVVRRVPADRKAGLHRVAWDLRRPSVAPTDLDPPQDLAPWESAEKGPLVPPGAYSASLEAVTGDTVRTLAGPVPVQVVPLQLATLGAADAAAVDAFRNQVRDLRRAVLGASDLADDLETRIDHLRQALVDTPAADPALSAELETLDTRLDDIRLALEGDATKSARNVFQPPAIKDRVERIAADQWVTTQPPTATHRQALKWASEAFATELSRLRDVAADLSDLETRADAAGAPWTPGRVPSWTER